jgi:hypothetical protein
MSIEVTTKSVTPHDVSLTLTGSPQQLVPANQYRTHLQFQAPTASNLIYSYTNPLCAAGLTGCFTLYAGATFGPAFGIPATAVYVNGTAGQLVPATEC